MRNDRTVDTPLAAAEGDGTPGDGYVERAD